MVARIVSGSSIAGLLNYNEIKVEKGTATLLQAENFYHSEASQLSYYDKLDSFKTLLIENKRIEKGTFHVSLNFDTSENPKQETLKEIAQQYMEKIGYGKQPYLVYQHHDANHAHIHIVSVKVDSEGKKINEDFMKRRSETARKEIEIDYKLVKASEKIKSSQYIQAALFKADYGRQETKEAITKIVRSVNESYKTSTLSEYQSVLSQFNIKAEKISGTNKEKDYQGLKYYITDSTGEKLSTGIKASAIYSSPTLQKLKPFFEINKDLKKDFKHDTKSTIENLLKNYTNITKEDLASELHKKNIQVKYAEGKAGTFGISFIDNKNKVVFNGSELGKEYTWNTLKHRIAESSHNTKAAKEVLAVISSIYNQIRKEKYFFESSIIKDINNLNLSKQLITALPGIDRKDAEKYVKQFSNYKSSKLKETQKKEQGYFSTQVKTGLDFIGKNTAVPIEEKLKFLARYQLMVTEKNGSLEIRHSKGGDVKVGFNGSLQQLLGTKESIDLKSQKFEELLPFKKDEKMFIENIVNEKKELSGLSHMIFNYKQFRPFLSIAKQEETEKTLARNSIKQILDLFPGVSVKDMLKALENRGFILDNKNGNYTLHYFQYPGSKVPVSDKLNAYLNNIKYTSPTLLVNDKYALLTRLYHNLDRKDLAGSIKEVEKLHKINPVLATKVIKEALPVVEAFKKDKSPENLKTAIETIIKSIELSGPNLIPDKIITQEKTNEQSKGVGILTALLDGGNDEPSKAVKSHHSKNKRKPKQNL